MTTRYPLFIALIFLFISCQKGSNTPPNKPAEPESFEVIIYSASGSGIMAFDLKQEKMLWQSTVPTDDINAIVYDEGVLYTSTPNSVSAVDATSGIVKWQKNAPFPINGNGYKSQCRPVIKDSLLYSIMSGDSYHSILICRNKNTGTEVWRKDISPMVSPEYEFTTPVVVGDKVIAMSHYNSMPRNVIFCLNRFTGSTIWTNGEISTFLSAYPFSPDSSQVIFLGRYSGGEFNSFDVNTGKLLWQSSSPFGVSSLLVIPYQNNRLIFPGYTMDNTGVFDLSGKMTGNTANTDSMWRVTTHKENIYSINFGYRIVCRNMDTNKELWRVPLPTRNLWDSIGASGSSWEYTHTSFITNPTVDNDEILYYYESISTSLVKVLTSLFLYDAKTGVLKKEIKLAGSNPFMGKHLVVVKKGEVFYPTTKWAN